MVKKIGVDGTLTFDPKGPFQGYKVYQFFQNWPTIEGLNS